MRELRVRVKLSDAKTMYKDVSHALTLNTEMLIFYFSLVQGLGLYLRSAYWQVYTVVI